MEKKTLFNDRFRELINRFSFVGTNGSLSVYSLEKAFKIGLGKYRLNL